MTSRKMNVWRISENGYDKQTAPGCRVIRKITEKDKRKLFRDEEIDGEAWQDILERMDF